MSTRIGLHTTLWKRADVENIVLPYYGRLASILAEDDIKLILIAAGSEGDASRERATRAGWHYIETENEPLGRKNNDAMEAFQSFDVDGVVIFGSDDLITASYFRRLAREITAGIGMFRFRGVHFYDLSTDSLVYSPLFMSGAGRFLSAAVLDDCDWRPWPDDRARRLDGSIDNVHRGYRQGFVHADGEATIVDVKASVNMWDFQASIDLGGGASPVEDAPAWWAKNFPGLYNQLSALTICV